MRSICWCLLVAGAVFAQEATWREAVSELGAAEPELREAAERRLRQVAPEEREAVRMAVEEEGEPEALRGLRALERAWQAIDSQDGLLFELQWSGQENFGSYRPGLLVRNVGEQGRVFALPIEGSGRGLRYPRLEAQLEAQAEDGSWQALPPGPPVACGMMAPRRPTDFVRIAPGEQLLVERFLPWLVPPAEGDFRVRLRYLHAPAQPLVAVLPDEQAEVDGLMRASSALDVWLGPLLVER